MQYNEVAEKLSRSRNTNKVEITFYYLFTTNLQGWIKLIKSDSKYVMLQKIYISDKCWNWSWMSFELSIHIEAWKNIKQQKRSQLWWYK